MPDETLAVAERRTRAWRRENRLRRLGFENYKAYIASPEWRARRAEFWNSDETAKECAVCGGEAVLLHHKTYDRVGEEDLTDLAALCDPCHRLVHELERRGDLGLDFDGLVDLARAAANRRNRKKPAAPNPEALAELRRLEHSVAAHRRRTNMGKQATRHLERKERRLGELRIELKVDLETP